MAEDDGSTPSRRQPPRDPGSDGRREPATGEPLEKHVETSRDGRSVFGIAVEEAVEVCHLEGLMALEDALENELDSSLEGVRPDLRYASGRFELTVKLRTAIDSDGTVVSRPVHEFEEVVAATPRSVTVTAVVDGDERECHHEIEVERVVERKG
ncbi:hypothetical protein [Halobiforma nitratireducens]|uniref:Uncharacterized protein n=1 Tax=Halobiforma nitratireducens JCM 10879 TaxID=1227454 RepID=M0M0Q6_9EURY|nr:hypothetical protein [Halobiforma nitratireducens]EMA38204.1 hypothetical protein C446_10155 [Halobiforma nitratireducens JCM 10879]